MYKANITLLPNLSPEQKQEAYKIMGYYLIEYQRTHSVDEAIAITLINKGLADSSYSLSPIAT